MTTHERTPAPPPAVLITPERESLALDVLRDGGMVMVMGPIDSGKTTLAHQLVAAGGGHARLLDFNHHLTDLPDGLPDGPLVVTCGTGNGRYHEHTASQVAQVAALRLPDMLLAVYRLSDGARKVVGGGWVKQPAGPARPVAV